MLRSATEKRRLNNKYLTNKQTKARHSPWIPRDPDAIPCDSHRQRRAPVGVPRCCHSSWSVLVSSAAGDCSQVRHSVGKREFKRERSGAKYYAVWHREYHYISYTRQLRWNGAHRRFALFVVGVVCNGRWFAGSSLYEKTWFQMITFWSKTLWCVRSRVCYYISYIRQFEMERRLHAFRTLRGRRRRLRWEIVRRFVALWGKGWS